MARMACPCHHCTVGFTRHDHFLSTLAHGDKGNSWRRLQGFDPFRFALRFFRANSSRRSFRPFSAWSCANCSKATSRLRSATLESGIERLALCPMPKPQQVRSVYHACFLNCHNRGFRWDCSSNHSLPELTGRSSAPTGMIRLFGQKHHESIQL